jgi:hypothetical protein
MIQKAAVHIFLLTFLIVLVGCGRATDEEIESKKVSTEASFYDNPEQGIRIETIDGWSIEKETAKSVKFTSDKIIAIISVIPREKTVSEIKKELLAGAGDVTVIGEGLNFVSWKSERQESIRTQVWVEEKADRHVIVTMMTPHELYEENQEKIEMFRESLKIY